MKEAPKTYPGLIFQELFLDEISTRKNGGIPTDVVFDKGIGEFNGSSSYLKVAKKLSGDTLTFRFKIESIGFSSTDTAAFYLFDNRDASNIYAPALYYLYSQGGWVMWLNGGAHKVISDTFSVGDKLDIVFTINYTDDYYALYINSTLKASSSTSLSIIDYGTNIYICSRFTADSFMALDLDLVEIYNRALSPSEISNLYEGNWNIEQKFGGEFGANLVKNGTFDTDSDWTFNPLYFKIENGVLHKFGIGSQSLVQTISTVIGKTYNVSFEIAGLTGGTPSCRLNAAVAININSNGHYSANVVADGEGIVFIGNAAIFELDNVIVQEVLPNTLIDFDSSQGVAFLGDLSEQSILTDITFKKLGSNYGASFDGVGSKIDLGVENIGVKAITVMGWIYPKSWGEAGAGMIMSNDKLYFVLGSGTDKIYFYSDGATASVTADNSIQLNKKQFIAVTRTSLGVANFYIGDSNNPPTLSGSADQDSGVPVAGTDNVFIGNRDAADRTFDGEIPILKVVEGILSLEQITQFWSETKKHID